MEPFSAHLHKLKEWADQSQLEDRFPPRLRPEDGSLVASRITRGVSYYITTKVFIKRQPHEDELGLDLYGNPVVNPYIADRLRNEAAALEYVAKHTAIPVPKLLGLWVENGLVHLKTALVHSGVTEFRYLDDPPAAVEKISEQLHSAVIPQLRKLRRDFMGSADPGLPVIPPRRLWKWKDDRVWPSMPGGDYVFCHTDLDRQNLLVDPETLEIACVLDWETSGFFPEGFELPYWEAEGHSEKTRMSQAAKERESAAFRFPESPQDEASAAGDDASASKGEAHVKDEESPADEKGNTAEKEDSPAEEEKAIAEKEEDPKSVTTEEG